MTDESQRIRLREQFGADYVEAEGPAEFIHWAADSFHKLLVAESNRYASLRVIQERRERAAQEQQSWDTAQRIGTELRRMICEIAPLKQL